MPLLSLTDLADPNKFGFPAGSAIYGCKFEARRAVIEAHNRIKGPEAFSRFWDRILSDDERVKLGNDLTACYAANPFAANHLGPLRGWSLEQAIVEIAHSLGFLASQDRLWLLKDIGISSDALEMQQQLGIPVWNKRTGKLHFEGKLCRELNVARAKAIVPILDEFQAQRWPEYIGGLVFTGHNPEAIYQTVRNINKGLVGIKFSVQGQDIHWNPTAS